jgi:hypothetical protein
MCLICVQYQSGKLTPKEALQNIGEMKSYVDEEHFKETVEFLNEEKAKEEWTKISKEMNAPYEELEDDDYYEETGFGD